MFAAASKVEASYRRSDELQGTLVVYFQREADALAARGWHSTVGGVVSIVGAYSMRMVSYEQRVVRAWWREGSHWRQQQWKGWVQQQWLGSAAVVGISSGGWVQQWLGAAALVGGSSSGWRQQQWLEAAAVVGGNSSGWRQQELLEAAAVVGGSGNGRRQHYM